MIFDSLPISEIMSEIIFCGNRYNSKWVYRNQCAAWAKNRLRLRHLGTFQKSAPAPELELGARRTLIETFFMYQIIRMYLRVSENYCENPYNSNGYIGSFFMGLKSSHFLPYRLNVPIGTAAYLCKWVNFHLLLLPHSLILLPHKKV